MLGCQSSGFGASEAAHGFTVHFDPVGIVDEAVEDGIGHRWYRRSFHATWPLGVGWLPALNADHIGPQGFRAGGAEHCRRAVQAPNRQG